MRPDLPAILQAVLGVLAGALLGVALAGPAAAADGRRVALVLGNGDYAHVTDLPNPPNDARGVAQALERLGFEVHAHVDTDVAGLRRALRDFTAQLPGADVVLFFYAGHGLQFQGRNYLVPVDARLEQEADLHFEAVELDLVLDLLEGPERTALIFLDACRDNPLARSLARNLGPTRSAQLGRGLARVEGGIGTLIGFATAPGAVALDGEGGNSPFTEALLEYIDAPGLEVRQMLSRVRDQVYRETGGEQLPWDNSSLRSDFYFNPEPEPEPAPPPQVAALPPDAPPSPDESAGRTSNAELAYWQAIQGSGRASEYELFLRQFPDSIFADLARARLAALQEDEAAPQPAPAPAPAILPAQPDPPPAPEIAIETIDAIFVAPGAANFRAGPSVDGLRLGTLTAGSRVTVLGKVEGANWYQIERPEGDGIAYVYAPLLQDAAEFEQAQAAAAAAPAPEPAPPAEAPEPQTVTPAVAPPEPTPEPQSADADTAGSAGGARRSEQQTAALIAPREAPPKVDPQALAAQLLDGWRPGRFRYEDPVYGQCSESANVSGYQPQGAPEIVLAGQAGTGLDHASGRRHGSFKTDAELTAFAGTEGTALIEYKYLKANTRGGWCLDLALDRSRFNEVIHRSPFLAGRTQVGAIDRHSRSGVRFLYALSEVAGDAGRQECLLFMGARTRHRIDGFACSPPGGALAKEDALRFLDGVRIPDVLG